MTKLIVGRSSERRVLCQEQPFGERQLSPAQRTSKNGVANDRFPPFVKVMRGHLGGLSPGLGVKHIYLSKGCCVLQNQKDSVCMIRSADGEASVISTENHLCVKFVSLMCAIQCKAN